MSNIKIAAICGSMRFSKEMKKIAWDLEDSGKYLVIQCAYNEENSSCNKPNHDLIHRKKIEVSDAIYVVNVDGYIGESTKNEIEYAKSLNKEIIYFEPIE